MEPWNVFPKCGIFSFVCLHVKFNINKVWEKFKVVSAKAKQRKQLQTFFSYLF